MTTIAPDPDAKQSGENNSRKDDKKNNMHFQRQRLTSRSSNNDDETTVTAPFKRSSSNAPIALPQTRRQYIVDDEFDYFSPASPHHVTTMRDHPPPPPPPPREAVSYSNFRQFDRDTSLSTIHDPPGPMREPTDRLVDQGQFNNNGPASTSAFSPFVSAKAAAAIFNRVPTNLHAPSSSFGRPYRPAYVPPYAGFDASTNPHQPTSHVPSATLIPFIPVTNQPIHHNTQSNPPRRRKNNQRDRVVTSHHSATSHIAGSFDRPGDFTSTTSADRQEHFNTPRERPSLPDDSISVEIAKPISNLNHHRLAPSFPRHRTVNVPPTRNLNDDGDERVPVDQGTRSLQRPQMIDNNQSTQSTPPYIRFRSTFPPPQLSLRTPVTPARSLPTTAATTTSTTTSTTTTTTTTTTTPSPPSTAAPFNRFFSRLQPEHGQPLGLLDYDSITDAPATTTAKPRRRVKQVKRINNKNKLLQQQQQQYNHTLSSSSDTFSSTANIQITGPQASRPVSASASIASRPVPLTLATKCDSKICRLPDCNCASAKIPGGLRASQVPQIVLLTFDDAVNDLNWELYEELFNSGRKNPNGCPPLGTFYVSHEWTDYSQVQTLYARGHEMASHSVTHSFGEKFSKNHWLREINGQREILHLYGGVPMNEVRGMRAPFLAIGGNKQFEMLWEGNFTYDSSMPVFENNPPFYPYTLDYAISHECMITPCPTKSFPGLWEVGMVMWQDLRGGRCSMVEACFAPETADDVHLFMMNNFNRHYKSNRAPFGIFYHSAWFNTEHRRKGFLKFMDEIMAKDDVYFVTNWQMIEWMRNPTPLSQIQSFAPWSCDKPTGQSECPNPRVCSTRHSEGSRLIKTCQSCPTHYPWVGKTSS